MCALQATPCALYGLSLRVGGGWSIKDEWRAATNGHRHSDQVANGASQMDEYFLHHTKLYVQEQCRDCRSFNCKKCRSDNFVMFGEAESVFVNNAFQRMEEYRRGR